MEVQLRGDSYVFDIGESVKIVTLVRNLILLSGYTPDVDSEFKFVGLRTGEKRYEDVLMSEENKE